MITEKTKRKARALAFWDKYGREAAEEAFGITKKTLYLWKNQITEGGGKLEALNEPPCRPKNIRNRRNEWPETVRTEIRRLREEHPNLGKEKIFSLLSKLCNEQKISCPNQA